MTNNIFRKAVKEFLQAPNLDKIEITDDTVLSSLLKTDDGYGVANSQNIFKQRVIYTMATNITPKPKIKFPDNWQNLTVAQFADSFKGLLTMLILVLFSIASQAQLQVTLGTTKTVDKNAAVTVGISYIRSLDSIWKSKELYLTGKHSIFTVNPQVSIQTGTQDAFSSIEAKLTGMIMSFKTKQLYDTTNGVVEHITIPDVSKGANTFPMSLGVETNNTFTVVNGIAEVGWVPYYQSAVSNTPELFKYSKFGIFLQGGYKFKGDSNNTKLFGGQIDQSGERINNALLRTKGSLSIDTKKLVNVSGINMGIVGSADVWYDFMNNKFYQKIQAVGRFYLATGQFFDILYAKGSGAPNFNQGDQYGVGLTITF